jgi:hypothetical protein
MNVHVVNYYITIISRQKQILEIVALNINHKFQFFFNSEYPKKTTDLSQVIDKTLSQSCIKTCTLSGAGIKLKISIVICTD